MPALSQRARVAIVGTLGAAGAFFMFGGLGLFSSAPTDPDHAVPKSTFLFASINYAELRRSPLHEVLFAEKSESFVDRRALGITRLADACGFDPLSRVEKLAVAVPEDGDKGDFGVAARVVVSREELGRCTDALTAQRGTKAEAKSLHGFSVIDAGGASLAYGHDLLVAGKGSWLTTMLATADAKNPSVRDAELHTTVRRDLTSKDGWGAPTVLVSAILPRSLRDRIRNEMEGEVGARDAAESAMAGVLGVSAVGVALRAGTGATSAEIAAELVCDAEEACAGVEKLLAKKRFDWSKELSYRMVGLGPLLDSIHIERSGAKVRVTAGAPASALAATLDRILRLRARRAAQPPEPAPPPEPRKPDERLPAKP
ncbi:MAG: hypothetical protein KIT84_11770 [Labilithrix sp.]|nr:hypothetical protein [Labilithrix sp.]MCW5811688.1 hypothetical protein [Labilithrix sp.]